MSNKQICNYIDSITLTQTIAKLGGKSWVEKRHHENLHLEGSGLKRFVSWHDTLSNKDCSILLYNLFDCYKM